MEPEKPIIAVATEEFQPYTKIFYRDDGSIFIEGPMSKFLNTLAKFLNVDYVLKRPDDRIYGGRKLPNGSWTGATGLVHRGEAELFLGPAGIDPQWGGVVEYSVPVYTESNVLLMIRPTTVNDIGNFLRPFTPEVWWMVLSSLVCIIIAMAFLTWVEDRLCNSSSKFSLSKAIIWAIQTLAQESTEWLPEEAGGRILELTWLFASLIFMSSYAGILTAMLTVPNVVIPIDSKDDLVKQSAISWRVRGSSHIQKYFRDSELDVDQKVYAGAGEMKGNCWHSRDPIRDGEFVAVCTTMTSRQILAWDFSATGKCHMYIGREPVYSKSHGVLVFRPDSPYYTRTNIIILRIHQAGLMDKWVLDEAKNATQCLRPPGNEERDVATPALPVEALLGPFVLHVTGMFISMVAFLLELVVHRYSM